MTVDSPELLAADSFRVRLNPVSGAPEVRGFRRHLARFGAAAREALDESAPAEGAARKRLEAFLTEAPERIADYGPGFPRLELWAGTEGGEPRAGLSLRPLPELRDDLRMRTVAGTRLVHPERKGPNLSRLTTLNRELGAEALLLDGAGHAVEGATTSLAWWEGERLWTADSVARVASVTEALLLGIAAEHGVTASRGLRPPAVLARCEVWSVNALHGIRLVTHIDGVALPAPELLRLRRFRAALDRCWEPVPGAS
ncbi:aminotransferase class IV [Leucobacter massiliensis]|uniref:aminotransferase class IV n=1 Tax=Leucobacter massiliensis TaxID=1686285 RepID=UPI0015E2CDEF|nr:aminotransferase class IV [Leucobacter massiliensis]